MKTQTGIRCDSCTRIEKKDPLAPDKRPPFGSRDRYFDFVVPPRKDDINMLTGKVKDGCFRGIAIPSAPKQLAGLHSCPGCAPRVQKAFKLKDPRLLPPGPLREIMEEAERKYGLRNLRMG